jgi:hypothetical protein
MGGCPVASGIEAPGDVEAWGKRPLTSAILQKGDVLDVIILIAGNEIKRHPPVLLFEIQACS